MLPQAGGEYGFPSISCRTIIRPCGVDGGPSVKRMLHANSDEMLKKMEIVGKTTFQEDLRADSEFWNELENEEGFGYRA